MQFGTPRTAPTTSTSPAGPPASPPASARSWAPTPSTSCCGTASATATRIPAAPTRLRRLLLRSHPAPRPTPAPASWRGQSPASASASAASSQPPTRPRFTARARPTLASLQRPHHPLRRCRGPRDPGHLRSPAPFTLLAIGRQATTGTHDSGVTDYPDVPNILLDGTVADTLHFGPEAPTEGVGELRDRRALRGTGRSFARGARERWVGGLTQSGRGARLLVNRRPLSVIRSDHQGLRISSLLADVLEPLDRVFAGRLESLNEHAQ